MKTGITAQPRGPQRGLRHSPTALAILGLVAFLASGGTGRSASTVAKAPYDIDSPADVERAIATTFAPRRPPMDLPPIEAAWKDIVADVTKPPVKIIFDTDIGTDIDDAITLCFALRRPELEVCAITTSRGEVGQRAAIVSTPAPPRIDRGRRAPRRRNCFAGPFPPTRARSGSWWPDP